MTFISELKLEEVVAVGLDGRMTEAAGNYAGLRPKQARAKIIEDLENNGFVEKIEEISQVLERGVLNNSCSTRWESQFHSIFFLILANQLRWNQASSSKFAYAFLDET